MMRGMDRHPGTLAGEVVRLEPLAVRAAGRALARLARPAHVALAQRQAADAREAALGAWLDEALTGPYHAFATVLQETGEIAGSTRFLNVRPHDRSVEIGWTWLAPDGVGHRRERGGEAADARARVRALGCRRVELKTDALNVRSRGAMEAFGAVSRACTASTCSCAAARTGTRPGTAWSTTSGRRCGPVYAAGSGGAEPSARSSTNRRSSWSASGDSRKTGWRTPGKLRNRTRPAGSASAYSRAAEIGV